jgi:hypothetical protein
VGATTAQELTYLGMGFPAIVALIAALKRRHRCVNLVVGNRQRRHHRDGYSKQWRRHCGESNGRA